MGKPDLRETSLRLVTYTGEPVKLKGEYDAWVEYQGKLQTLHLYVAQCNGRYSLYGRNWLRVLRLDWATILQVEQRSDRQIKKNPAYLKTFLDIFDKELGTIQVLPVQLDLQPEVVPTFFPPSPHPICIER